MICGRDFKLKSVDFEQIKSNKPFKIWDLVLYCPILVLVLALLFAFVIFPADSAVESTGFKIILNDKEVFVFDYSTRTYSLDPESIDQIIVEDLSGGFCIVKVISDKNSGAFNTVTANIEKHMVSVTESNCSESKECVHTPDIKDSHGVIVCAPHKLKVVPTNGYRPVVTG